MRHGYFEQIKDNYSIFLGTSKSIILFFDGKNVTSSPFIDLYDFERGSFSKSLLLTANEFSSRWKCKALVGADEIVFIIDKPDMLIKKYRNTVSNVISLTTQEIFLYFNDTYKGKGKIFFHGKVFAIPFERIDSFIKYQAERYFNVLTVYWMKKYGYFKTGIKLDEMVLIAKKHDEYNNLISFFKEGLLVENRKYYKLIPYINGEKEEYILPKDDNFSKFKKANINDF